MRLAILDADTLRDDLRGLYISYGHMCCDLLRQVSDQFEYDIYSVNEHQYPEHIDNYDAYLITGSKSSAYDDDRWIKSLTSYIQCLYQTDKKILGICFGHQLIAQALGGKVVMAKQGWGVGVHNYQTSTQADKKLGLPENFSLLVSHKDQVKELPLLAERLAKSDFCPNAAYRIGNQVLCFQGHPEFVREYADALMQARKDIIPVPVFDDAQQSLSRPTQHIAVAKVLLAFMQGEKVCV